MTNKEAMKLALEALRKSMQGNLVFDEAMEAFKALEEALAKQEQGEPVAWTPRIERIYKDGVLVEQTIQYNPQGQKLPYPHEPSLPVGKVILYTGEGFACAPFHKIEWSDGMMPPVGTQLYTTPQQRTWVGLTDEDIYLNCPNWLSQEQCKSWTQQIQAKLKEKNT
jgi:hypothetical protein